MSERYKAVEGSETGHCCFGATVVDTQTPRPGFCDKPDWVCECFDMKSAQKIADALNAAIDQTREDGWQPIETAPNGAWLLVHSDRGWIGLARRSDPDYAPDEGWFEDEHTEFIDPAWLTHWRPLPAPPDIDRARGKGGKEDSND